MKRIILVAVMFATVFSLSAQEADSKNSYMMSDLSLGANTDIFVGALSFQRLHTVVNDKLHLGYGLRLNYHQASDQNYITAPFEFTAEEKIDTLRMSTINTLSLSANIHLAFSVTPKLLVGFNIDAIGLSFGAEQDANIRYLYSDPSAADVLTKAKPTSANVLLVGDNDIGTLNSEFYVRYKVGGNLYLRPGFSFFFSEYTTTIAGSDDNNRFRNKIGYPFLAVSYRI